MRTVKIAWLLFFGGLCVMGSPIAVSGGGFWYESYLNSGNTLPDGGFYNLAFSGSNGTDSVAVSVGNNLHGFAFLGQPSTFTLLVNPATFPFNGSAEINGVVSPTFRFSIGDGGGFVTLLDSSLNPIGSVDLVSYLSVSRITSPFLEHGLIVVSPEPGTSVLMLLGLVMLVACYKRSQRAHHFFQ